MGMRERWWRMKAEEKGNAVKGCLTWFVCKLFARYLRPLDQLQDMFCGVSLCHAFNSGWRYYAARSASRGAQWSTCMGKRCMIFSPSDEWNAINFRLIKCNLRDFWFILWILRHCVSFLFPKWWYHFKMKGISTDPYRPFHIFFRNLWGLKMKLIFFVRKFN